MLRFVVNWRRVVCIFRSLGQVVKLFLKSVNAILQLFEGLVTEGVIILTQQVHRLRQVIHQSLKPVNVVVAVVHLRLEDLSLVVKLCLVGLLVHLVSQEFNSVGELLAVSGHIARFITATSCHDVS